MNLYEHEGKALLRKHGIKTPKGVLLSSDQDATTAFANLGQSAVLKAQILAGNRLEHGGIVFCQTATDVSTSARALFAHAIAGTSVSLVLLEERLVPKREFYVCCTYDTATRAPMLLIGANGGHGVERQQDIRRFALDARTPETSLSGITEALALLSPTLPALCAAVVETFFEEDARQVEINPVAELADGTLIALDAKIALDEASAPRHPERSVYEDRSQIGKVLTERERAARQIDVGAHAHRGTAGTYLELDGDIAVLFSGGGASLVNMDAMQRIGLAPANYTEYSGNPPKEKVRALARIVLAKPGLRGALIVGGIANFTDVRETFAGIADALDELRPTYPIVVRRAGPHETEGLDLLRACAERNGLRMEVFGKDVSMESAVARMRALLL